MLTQPAAIIRFWTWFGANTAALFATPDADHPIWDQALAQVQLIHPDLRFEMSDPVDGRREFVITAQGDAALFPLVDDIVANAPSLNQWTFVALKPAMGFDFVTTYEGVAFDSKSMWFLPLASSERPADIALRIGIPNLTDRMRPVAGHAVIVILETGLGERALALDVQHIEFADLPREPDKAGYIELPDLPAYIAWHKRKHAQP